jgi:hypothetical protein
VSVFERIELGLLIFGLILIAAGALQARYRYVKGRRQGRFFYWMTSGFGTFFFAVGVGKIWPNAVVVTVFFAAIVTGSAYLSTPYLKIGERIYALSPDDREPDPPDGEPERK